MARDKASNSSESNKFVDFEILKQILAPLVLEVQVPPGYAHWTVILVILLQ